VFMEIDGTAPENVSPTPSRENEELQQVLLVPLAGLQQTLNHLELDKGYVIDARLRSLSVGLALGKLLE